MRKSRSTGAICPQFVRRVNRSAPSCRAENAALWFGSHSPSDMAARLPAHPRGVPNGVAGDLDSQIVRGEIRVPSRSVLSATLQMSPSRRSLPLASRRNASG